MVQGHATEAETETNDTEHQNETVESEKEQAKIPIPLPRKSNRVKKKPKYLDVYHCSEVNHGPIRPIDNKTDALNKLLASGILTNVSTDMANKLWEAVMK